MLKKKLQKQVYKGIGVIKKLNNVLPQNALLTIYKSFVRPHIDYGDILYHQSYYWKKLQGQKLQGQNFIKD